MFKQVYHQGKLDSTKRCVSTGDITPISGSPPHPSNANDAVGVILLNEKDTECQLCYNEFLTNMDTEDEIARMRLPVIGSCSHVFCYGCVLRQHMARAEVNGGRVPRRINCMECRKAGAFHPREPKFDRRLIDWLSRSVPVVRDERS